MTIQSSSKYARNDVIVLMQSTKTQIWLQSDETYVTCSIVFNAITIISMQLKYTCSDAFFLYVLLISFILCIYQIGEILH